MALALKSDNQIPQLHRGWTLTFSYETRLLFIFILLGAFIFITIPNTFSVTQRTLTLVVNFPILIWLLLEIRANKIRGLIGLDPMNIALYSFLIFHVLFNNIVFKNEYLLYQRNIDIDRSDLLISYILNYNLILFIAFAFYRVGNSFRVSGIGKLIGLILLPKKLDRSMLRLVGLSLILLGIVGNILLIGSISGYISKLFSFYTISDVYFENVETVGGGLVPKKILESCFIPGVLLVFWSYGNRVSKRFYLRIIVLVLFTLVFNGTSGQRSQILNPIIYLGISYILFLRKLSVFKIFFSGIIFFIAVLGIGLIRDQAGMFETVDISLLFDNFGTVSSLFTSQYLTNFSGSLTLLDIIGQEGFLEVNTLLSGFTGLLGGPTPTTTQAYVWEHLTGDPFGSNPRFGLFIELYANLGYSGLIFMIIPGVAIKAFSKGFRRLIKSKAITVKILIPFIILMSLLVVNGNASYFGPQIFYLSWPFYLLLVLKES